MFAWFRRIIRLREAGEQARLLVLELKPHVVGASTNIWLCERLCDQSWKLPCWTCVTLMAARIGHVEHCHPVAETTGWQCCLHNRPEALPFLV